MTARPVSHTVALAGRRLAQLWRQPAFVVVMLVQPIIWLLLFAALFERVADIPGFEGSSYLTYIAPGVVVMNAVMTSGWSGMSFIDDIDRGVMDNLLATPVWRGALNAGLICQQAVTVAVQSAIIVAVALIAGARFAGDFAGVMAMIVIALLLAACFTALSNAFSLVVRQRESLIGAVTVLTLPLIFMSTVFMQAQLMPGWIESLSRFNPVNWAAVAAREAAGASTDWTGVGGRVALLLLLLLACGSLATRSFRAYQRSL